MENIPRIKEINTKRNFIRDLEYKLKFGTTEIIFSILVLISIIILNQYLIVSMFIGKTKIVLSILNICVLCPSILIAGRFTPTIFYNIKLRYYFLYRKLSYIEDKIDFSPNFNIREKRLKFIMKIFPIFSSFRSIKYLPGVYKNDDFILFFDKSFVDKKYKIEHIYFNDSFNHQVEDSEIYINIFFKGKKYKAYSATYSFSDLFKEIDFEKDTVLSTIKKAKRILEAKYIESTYGINSI